MKWQRVHDGIVLITLGLLILLFTLGVLRFPILKTLYMFWPVFIIGAGVNLMFRRFPVVETVVFFLTVILFLGLGLSLQGSAPGEIRQTGTPLGEFPATAELETDLAEIRIQGADTGDAAYRLEAAGQLPDAAWKPEESRLELKTGVSSGRDLLPWGKGRRIRLELDSNRTWEIRGRFSLGRCELDLQQVPLEALDLELSLTDTRILLPEIQGEIPVRIRGNLSGVEVRIPRSSGYRIRWENNLSSLRLDGQRIPDIPGEAPGTGLYDIRVEGNLAGIRLIRD